MCEAICGSSCARARLSHITVCNRCEHKAETHGDIESLPDEKLEGLVVQLQQRLAAKRVEERALLEAEQAKLHVQLPDAPPFESPAIHDILRYYLMLAYGDSNLQQEQRQRLNELSNFLLAILDANFLASAPPALQTERSFAPLYQRWLKYCFRCEENPVPQFAMTRVFGRLMLLAVAPMLHGVLRSGSFPLPGTSCACVYVLA